MKPTACPICKLQVAPGTPTFPFCTERCRLIDLGNWLDGRYSIAGNEPTGDDEQKH